MRANQLGSHSQLRALVGCRWGDAEMPGCTGRSVVHPCPVPLPARASAAAAHGEVAQPSSTSLLQDKESLGLQRSYSYIWAKFKKNPRHSPCKWLLCRLANAQAHSIVECRQLESLKSVFQSLSPSILCPKRRRHFITSDIFPTNWQKTYLIFF